MKWNCFGSANCVCLCVCVNKEMWKVFREAVEVLEAAVDNTRNPPPSPSHSSQLDSYFIVPHLELF